MAARGNRDPVVVQRRALQDYPGRAANTGEREEPQEESIQHHRNKLPVLHDLRARWVVIQSVGRFGLRETKGRGGNI